MKKNYRKYLDNTLEKQLEKQKTKVPILKGCFASKNGGCFCSGDCKEIIGWRDKTPEELNPIIWLNQTNL